MSHYDDEWADDHGYVSCKCPECGHTFKTDSSPECPNCGFCATSTRELFDCADCGETFGEANIVDLLTISEEIGRNLCDAFKAFPGWGHRGWVDANRPPQNPHLR